MSGWVLLEEKITEHDKLFSGKLHSHVHQPAPHWSSVILLFLCSTLILTPRQWCFKSQTQLKSSEKTVNLVCRTSLLTLSRWLYLLFYKEKRNFQLSNIQSHSVQPTCSPPCPTFEGLEFVNSGYGIWGIVGYEPIWGVWENLSWKQNQHYEVSKQRLENTYILNDSIKYIFK